MAFTTTKKRQSLKLEDGNLKFSNIVTLNTYINLNIKTAYFVKFHRANTVRLITT
jgi:hypothetical protein